MKIFVLLVLYACTVQGQIPRYDVTMTPAEYNLLYTRDIFSDSTLPCTFDYQSTHWNNTQVRFKGHSTRYFPKKGFVVKFPSSNLFQGLKTATFNAMYTDKSCMREKLSWDLFDDIGEIASVSHYGDLSINGTWKGLYLFIDKPDKYFLINHGRAVGPMWEASDTYAMADFTVQPDSIIKLNYEQSVGTAADYVGLEQMIQTLNTASDSAFADTLARYFDVNSIVNWFAGNIVTMMGDSYVKSYLLYRDTTRAAQQWVTIPWDYDLSFGRDGDPTVPYPASLMNDDFAYTFPPLSGPSSVLKDRFWATPSLRERLRQRLDTVLQTVFTDEKQYAKIDSIVGVIQQDVALDPYKWGTVDDFYEHVEALKYYITARRNYLNATFINPPHGEYNDVTLPVSQLNVPYRFVAYDGRQLATLWFSNMQGLDSINVKAYPDSTPPNIPDPASGKYVRRWLRITPYPATATFSAKLQWSYQDVAANDREVGAGIQDEHLLRPSYFDGSAWNVLPGKMNAFGNFVTIDSINQTDCAPGNYFALMMSGTYTQKWFRAPLNYWHTWHDIKFFDSQHGFIVGDHGTLLRTTDAGTSWLEESIGLNLPFHKLAISSMNNIFAVGEYGACYRSVDSGKSWSRIDLGTARNLNDVYFSNPNLGVIAGDSSLLRRTTDGGLTWIDILGSHPGNLSCAFAFANTVIVFGDYVKLCVSDTSGLWSFGPPLRFIGTGNIQSIAKGDSSDWWAVGDSGKVIHADAMNLPDHQSIDVPVSSGLRNIAVFDSLRFYVSGGHGKILYTTDKGANWYTQYTADSHDLYGLTFTDSTHGYAVGNGGTILSTTTAGTETLVPPPQERIPVEYRLEQNYPNPFNPATTLSFAIRNSSFVTLKVYDVLGREVATITDEPMQPGMYTRSWNAGNLASGVYFSRLDVTGLNRGTRNFTQVRKMLLLK